MVQTCGQGDCFRVGPVCEGGVLKTCAAGDGTTEVADGRDNDCDGAVDDGVDCRLPDGGTSRVQSCYSYSGAGVNPSLPCRYGLQRCQEDGGWGALIRDVAVILLIVLGIHSCVAKPFYIPSDSMMPALRNGDRLIVSKYPYGWSYASVSFHLAPKFDGRLLAKLPQRGDIVVLEHPATRIDYIKRVIGLPGDTIELRPVMSGGTA